MVLLLRWPFKNRYKIKGRSPLPSPKKYSSRLWHGKKIGILGGSFNPPHEGHLHIAKTALRQYHLHAIWWMVSPQNPLKDRHTSFEKRYKMTQQFLKPHPRMVATSIEDAFHTNYSYQTIIKLKRFFPKTHFTWVAGMDNAMIFHRWDKWREILSIMPFIFFLRPPNTMAMNKNAIKLYKRKKNVSWNLCGKTRNVSSTALRQKQSNFITRFVKPL